MNEYLITGRTPDGRIVATETTEAKLTAHRIAESWRANGLAVVIEERPAS